jgi:hypothetical protein
MRAWWRGATRVAADALPALNRPPIRRRQWTMIVNERWRVHFEFYTCDISHLGIVDDR